MISRLSNRWLTGIGLSLLWPLLAAGQTPTSPPPLPSIPSGTIVLKATNPPPTSTTTPGSAVTPTPATPPAAPTVNKTQVTNIPPLVTRPVAEPAVPDRALIIRGPAATATPESTAPKPPSTPANPLLSGLLALRFDRSPEAMLRNLKLEQQGRTPTNLVERFQLAVNLGRWPAVAAFLKELPATDATQVYDHLLATLPRAGGAAPAPGQPPAPPNNAARQNRPQPVLSPDDVLQLADAAPSALTNEQIQKLGGLLRQSLSQGYAQDGLLARLKQGTRTLGGSSPEGRDRAARLLLAANLAPEARPFLPPLEAARQDNDVETLAQHAAILADLGRREDDPEATLQAWEINQQILTADTASATNRDEAARRCLEMAPGLPETTVTNWLRSSFANSPELGITLLAHMADAVARNRANRNPQIRVSDLARQHQAAAILLETVDISSGDWQSALDLLALNWMHEAALTVRQAQSRPNGNNEMAFDRYGNPLYIPPQMVRNPNQNRIQPIPPSEILPLAPQSKWLEHLDPSLAPRAHALIAELHLKDEAIDPCLRELEWLASRDPQAAHRLSILLVDTWSQSRQPRTPNRYNPVYNPVIYSGGYRSGSQGIPLTRARQNRNLRELTDLRQHLAELSIEPLPENVFVRAFAAAHSAAEVYRIEDVQQVFGPVEEMDLSTLSELLQTMRQRLAVQWRQPRVQKDEKTRRTDQQIEAEVLRGYDVVRQLVDEALRRDPDNWRLWLVQAAAEFDLAEFQYGKKVDLEIYVEKREAAFKSFAQAARLYAATVPSLKPTEETNLVYEYWFSANLGASDLTYVTRQQEPSTRNLDQIRQAILGLPGAAASRQLAMFGRWLGQTARTLSPELKPRFLRSGLLIVGDDPSADTVRDLVRHYADLLEEIVFDVRLDGDATVGHSQAFGVFVSLEHTADIERESGGFGPYLRQPNSSPYYSSSPYQTTLFVEAFEKQVREKATDRFEVLSLTFHDPRVQSRGTDRTGWRLTPLAYLVLQAKDPSVDRIPALQMDLNFSDSTGPVVLPIESQIILIDARPDRVEPRPIASLQITQILDSRQLTDGILVLEIRGAGKGLIPELRDLIDLSGRNIEKQIDQGLVLSGMDVEGDVLAALSERSWLLEMAPLNPDEIPDTFQFPSSLRPEAELTYKRYEDVDLVEVDPQVALAGLSLKPDRTWQWLIAGAAALAIGLPLIGRSLRRSKKRPLTAPSYAMPDEMTPFAVIGLLRRIQDDKSLSLTSTHQQELRSTIHRLEEKYFSPSVSSHQPINLDAVAGEWLGKAGFPVRR